jgi:hypothetical protein
MIEITYTNKKTLKVEALDGYTESGLANLIKHQKVWTETEDGQKYFFSEAEYVGSQPYKVKQKCGRIIEQKEECDITVNKPLS